MFLPAKKLFPVETDFFWAKAFYEKFGTALACLSPVMLQVYQTCPHLFFIGSTQRSHNQKGDGKRGAFLPPSQLPKTFCTPAESCSASSLAILPIQSQLPYAIHWLGKKNTWRSQPKKKKQQVFWPTLRVLLQLSFGSGQQVLVTFNFLCPQASWIISLRQHQFNS